MTKLMKRRTAIVMMLMMLFTSFSVIGVNAEGEEATVAAPAAVKLKAHSGDESVILTWDAVPGAVGYDVFDSAGNCIKADVTETQYKVKKLKDAYKKYKFTVKAYAKDSAGNKLYSPAATKSNAPVRVMRYQCRLKSGATLRSHSGPKQKVKLKGGQKVIATGFTAGQYLFWKKGSRFHMNGSRVSSVKPLYKRKGDYSRFEAENFVNDRGVASKTKRLIWISTYTQHVYYFTGSKNNWKCVDDWHCCTGRASTPTPTGNKGIKRIWKKVRMRHNVPWWSPFSSFNSLHGLAGPKSILGTPRSGGCVRNPDQKAKKVYKDAKIGTTVLVQ